MCIFRKSTVENMKQLRLLKCKIGQLPWKAVWPFLKKVNIYIQFSLVLDIYLKK